MAFSQGGLMVQAKEVEALQSFIKGLIINGKPAGECYAAEVVMYSKGYITLAATPALRANDYVDVFSYQAGQTITPVGGGTNTAFTATAADTNWPSPSNMLGMNEAFVGLEVGIDLELCDEGASMASLGQIPTAAAAHQIAFSMTYSVNEGNTINRNYGLIADLPSGAAIYAGATALAAATATTLGGNRDIGVQNGGPGASRNSLRIAQLWKPLTSYQHRLRVEKAATLVDGVNGAGYATGLLASNAFGVRVSYKGWYITAQV